MGKLNRKKKEGSVEIKGQASGYTHHPTTYWVNRNKKQGQGTDTGTGTVGETRKPGTRHGIDDENSLSRRIASACTLHTRFGTCSRGWLDLISVVLHI